MGKKSLIKSTTKQKAASPKKSASKKAAASPATSKPAEKKAAAKKPAATASTPKPASRKLPVSELLKLSFETWTPEKFYLPPADLVSTANYTAPPFFDGSAGETATLKALLARQFDLTALPEPPESAPAETASEAPESPPAETVAAADAAATGVEPESSPASEPEPPSEPPREPVPVAELLKLSFETWTPETFYLPPADLVSAANYTAPPFFDGSGEETATLKALLARQFDLTALPEPPESAPAETASAAPESPPAETVAAADAAATEAQKADQTPVVEVETAQVEPETPATITEPEAQTAAVSESVPEPEPAPAPEPVSQETPSAAPAEITPAPAAPESWSPPPPVCAGPPDVKEPPNNALRMLIGCLAAIFGLLLIASAFNSSNYYLKPTAGGLEIWQGRFSPKGKILVETIPNVALSHPVKSGYNREQAMTVVFDYYMNQATQHENVIGKPDFDAVVALYEQAGKYAPTKKQADLADKRLRTIKAQSLIWAADQATANLSPQSIDKALSLLNKAAGLATDQTQQQLIRVKIDALAAMQPEKTGPETEETATGRKQAGEADKKAR